MVVGGGLINYIVNKTIGLNHWTGGKFGVVVGKYRLLDKQLLWQRILSFIYFLLPYFYYPSIVFPSCHQRSLSYRYHTCILNTPMY